MWSTAATPLVMRRRRIFWYKKARLPLKKRQIRKKYTIKKEKGALLTVRQDAGKESFEDGEGIFILDTASRSV